MRRWNIGDKARIVRAQYGQRVGDIITITDTRKKWPLFVEDANGYQFSINTNDVEYLSPDEYPEEYL